MPCSYPIVSLILCALEKSNKSNASLPSFLSLPFTQPVNHHLVSNPNPPTYLSTPFSRGAKMRNKGQNQSKFIRFITIPIRVLGKARDLYVRSLTDCSHRVSHSDSVVLVTGQSSVFPRSFSASSSRSNDNEDYRDLIRAASVRGLGHRNEIDMLMKQQLMAMVESRGLPKSCSVGMGRIDEDEPCEFGEEDSCEPKVKSDLVYPRSKSCAVGKKTVLF